MWVFGYGSLMWRPGFDPARREPAILSGWHRKFCVRSRRHRGTAAQPGLVLGLAPGGQCHGIAYQVRAGEEERVRAYLYAREVPVYPYEEATVSVRLETGTVQTALTYLADPGHPDYLPTLGLAESAAMIARATGSSGDNIDYLRQTLTELSTLGMEEPAFQRLLARVESIKRV